MEKKYISKVVLDSSGISHNSYLRKIPAVAHLIKTGSMHFGSDVTFLVGENGCGKSTLTEGIAVAYGFNPEGGSKNFNFSTANSHSELHQHLNITKASHSKDGFFLRAESFYNLATNICEMDAIPANSPPIIESYGGVSLHGQSHGESFMALVQHRFGGNGMYILDEPESALSPMRLITLMCEIQRLVSQNSQFIIATHSPILMAFPGAEVLSITPEGIKSVDYKTTDHYQITRRFLEAPETMLDYMIG